ncbi:Golgi matrix protein [Aspergillus ochraceoroseus]|uniref:Golgi matrix protein n=1 Tax=Aspergillus ochraceoroseus TaxID=138278 RepID=A0A0F8U6E9_9EURO|nr:Golgi matrix protein [Aspergillus ochraceoroseus]
MPDGGKSKNRKKNKGDPKPKPAADAKNSTEALEESVESNDTALPPYKLTIETTSETTSESHQPEPSGNEKESDGALRSKDRFDALVRERDSLRVEVTDMRKSLEEIQSKHQTDMEALQQKLDDAERKKEHAESQFRGLLERVNTIKAQLGERLKEDAEEIAQARSRIEELEEQNSSMKQTYESKCSELTDTNRKMSKELSELRDRTNLSQQNWLREKDELMKQESYLQSEFEQAKEAMHNWEVLAMEERSIRENLGEKVIDLEEQLANVRDAYEKTAVERDSQAATVEGLQRALQEIQAARKQELRELVESSDAQLEELKQALSAAKKNASEADNSLQELQKELDRVRPFEKEVKEKNLLIGKLRHEAVTLNDHLTKALRFLKKGKPEDNVDRHIVTNHLLHFLALDRSDPKKFQILQLIAALLGWTDEQREQAGLARPGTSGSSGKLRVPSISMHRTPSTPTLATEFFDNGTTSKESLAELWSNFLEQESQASHEHN